MKTAFKFYHEKNILFIYELIRVVDEEIPFKSRKEHTRKVGINLIYI